MKPGLWGDIKDIVIKSQKQHFMVGKMSIRLMEVNRIGRTVCERRRAFGRGWFICFASSQFAISIVRYDPPGEAGGLDQVRNLAASSNTLPWLCTRDGYVS